MWSNAFTKYLSSVSAIMKTPKKKIVKEEEHDEAISEVVEVKVACDEDVENLLFLKGTKGVYTFFSYRHLHALFPAGCGKLHYIFLVLRPKTLSAIITKNYDMVVSIGFFLIYIKNWSQINY